MKNKIKERKKKLNEHKNFNKLSIFQDIQIENNRIPERKNKEKKNH